MSKQINDRGTTFLLNLGVRGHLKFQVNRHNLYTGIKDTFEHSFSIDVIFNGRESVSKVESHACITDCNIVKQLLLNTETV